MENYVKFQRAFEILSTVKVSDNNDDLTLTRLLTEVEIFRDKMLKRDEKIEVERIKESLDECQSAKGYALELEDAIKILVDVREKFHDKSNKYYNLGHTIDGQCSLIFDPDNIFYIYHQARIRVPEWFGEKYRKYEVPRSYD